LVENGKPALKEQRIDVNARKPETVQSHMADRRIEERNHALDGSTT
jgi:hypothetical protein